MRIFFTWGCILLLSFMLSCAKKSTPKINVTAPVTIEVPDYYPSTVEVRDAIFSAAHSLHWRPQDRAPGLTLIHYKIPGRESIIFGVDYSARQYTLQYLGSNKKAYALESGRIHPYFEDLALILHDAIQAKLARTSDPVPRLRVTPSVSIDFDNTLQVDAKKRELSKERNEKMKEEDADRRARVARILREDIENDKATALIGGNTQEKQEKTADKDEKKSSSEAIVAPPAVAPAPFVAPAILPVEQQNTEQQPLVPSQDVQQPSLQQDGEHTLSNQQPVEQNTQEQKPQEQAVQPPVLQDPQSDVQNQNATQRHAPVQAKNLPLVHDGDYQHSQTSRPQEERTPQTERPAVAPIPLAPPIPSDARAPMPTEADREDRARSGKAPSIPQAPIRHVNPEHPENPSLENPPADVLTQEPPKENPNSVMPPQAQPKAVPTQNSPLAPVLNEPLLSNDPQGSSD